MSRRPIATRPVLYPTLMSVFVVAANYAFSVIFVGLDYLQTYIVPETLVPILLAVPVAVIAARQRRRIYRLNCTLQDMVDHDGLTQLKSRQYLLNNVKVAAQENTVVMMIDVDHFKALNDTHGHQTGDRALQHMARIFADCCRAGDVISRYGGEEFVIVLKESDLSAAALIAKRIRKTLANRPLETSSGSIVLTVSIGISVLRDNDDMTEALVRADTAMYLAKKKGRDRVEMEGAA